MTINDSSQAFVTSTDFTYYIPFLVFQINSIDSEAYFDIHRGCTTAVSQQDFFPQCPVEVVGRLKETQEKRQTEYWQSCCDNNYCNSGLGTKSETAALCSNSGVRISISIVTYTMLLLLFAV